MQRNFLIPKPDNIVIGFDFGQGEDVSNMIVYRLKEDGFVEVVGYKRIGKDKDFTDDKIKEFLSNMEKME